MNKYAPFFIVGLLVFGGLFLFVSRNNNSANQSDEQKFDTCKEVAGKVTIVMQDELYEPQDVKIARCTKVTFTNTAKDSRWPASNIHPTHGIYPEFDPKEPVEPGSQWSFVFDKVGNWRYHDHLVPSIRGAITVSE